MICPCNRLPPPVGNKCDSPDKKVSTEEGKALASQMDIPFFETSAKDNLNIETVIRFPASQLANSCAVKQKKPLKIFPV